MLDILGGEDDFFPDSVMGEGSTPDESVDCNGCDAEKLSELRNSGGFEREALHRRLLPWGVVGEPAYATADLVIRKSYSISSCACT